MPICSAAIPTRVFAVVPVLSFLHQRRHLRSEALRFNRCSDLCIELLSFPIFSTPVERKQNSHHLRLSLKRQTTRRSQCRTSSFVHVSPLRPLLRTTFCWHLHASKFAKVTNPLLLARLPSREAVPLHTCSALARLMEGPTASSQVLVMSAVLKAVSNSFFPMSPAEMLSESGMFDTAE